MAQVGETRRDKVTEANNHLTCGVVLTSRKQMPTGQTCRSSRSRETIPQRKLARRESDVADGHEIRAPQRVSTHTSEYCRVDYWNKPESDLGRNIILTTLPILTPYILYKEPHGSHRRRRSV